MILITYDLKRPGQDYEELLKEIKNISGTWWHHLESTWLIKTGISPNEVFSRLKKYLDSNDRMLVIDITNASRQGWLPAEAWEWIKKHEK